LQNGAGAWELMNNVAFSQIPRTRSGHSAVSRVTVSLLDSFDPIAYP
jgi:hypothetical protein